MEENEIKNLYALVGKNISYSFSRNFFSQKFKNEGIKDSQYINFDIFSVEDFLSEIKKYANLKGLNVTIPYKEKIIDFLDELDPIAEKIGAVNTIKILKDGKLKGYNTDYDGFWQALKPYLKSFHQKALVLGTGGASKAVAFALKENAISFDFVSRNDKKHLSYEQITPSLLNDYHLIVNCTPLGTFPDVEAFPPIPYEFLTPKHLLFDLIYNPPKTQFLLKAEQKNATIINGYQMLVFQAERAYEIWQSD